MLTKFNATACKTDVGLQVEAGTRGFKIVMDEPEELGGTNTGMNPVEIVLSSFGGCLTILASMLADKMRLTFDDIRVELEGDIDLDGLAGVKGVRPGFQEIRYTFHFKTSEPKEKVERMVQMIESLCPVHDTISNTVKVVGGDFVID